MTTNDFTTRFTDGPAVLRALAALGCWMRLHDLSTFTFVLAGFTFAIHRNGTLLREEGNVVMEDTDHAHTE